MTMRIGAQSIDKRDRAPAGGAGRGRRLLAVAALLLSLSLSLPLTPAQAHPHAWIDLRVEILFDESGKIVGLREEWNFDEFYTVFVVEGLPRDASGQPDPALLRALAAENLHNLRDHDYFTDAWAGEQPLAFVPVSDYESFMRDRQLVMRFTLEFAEPVDPRTQAFGYAIYDPTYYIEMLHLKDDPIRLGDDAPAGCVHELEEPNPSFEAVSLAAALDRNESAGDGLGELFAERIHIRCE